MIKLLQNLLHITRTYKFSQAIPNIREHGIRVFLTNLMRETTGYRPSSYVKIKKRLSDTAINTACGQEWQDYHIISRLIADTRSTEVSSLQLKPVSMISIVESEAAGYSGLLQFQSIAEPLVSIVIPVYNNLKFTLECLMSISKYTKEISYEVIVIDDCSTDRTQDLLSNINNMTYLRNSGNLGFVRTCNRGLEKARGKYILFLNNDAQVTEGWLTELVKTFDDNHDAGAAGPKIIYPDGRLQEAGAMISRDCSGALIGVADDPALPRFNYVREVDYCSGTCLIVETRKFRELGGFSDEMAPSYFEDVDLCFRLRRLGLRIMYNPKSVIVHHLSVTSDSIDKSYKSRCIARNSQKLSEKWQEHIDDLNRVRLIAFYLPQFHPNPENDRWWGKGFTEWTNVAKARPNFAGHYQPHLPSDLGFYDLRLAEVMEQQAELAKRYGVNGFCYYYYWFGGKRMLEMPLERLLKTDKPDFPFCLCWANENWTRRWDGQDKKILLKQMHSDEDDRAVILDLIRYMRRPNYIRINGKPFLSIYRMNQFPDIKRTIGIWRDTCRKEGIGEIYLAMIESFEYAYAKVSPADYGFDASVEFPPHGMSARINIPGELLNREYNGAVDDYRELVLKYAKREVPGYTRFRGVMPSWDNTARLQNDSQIFAYSTPGAYQAWLEFIVNQTREQNFGDERVVFINAWNEWAEGAHLEPDRRFGHGYLSATRNASDGWLLKAR